MYILGNNIISSLGFTTAENFRAVKSGISGVKHYAAGTFDLPEAFMASLIDKEKLNDEFYRHCGKNEMCSDLEKAAILSVFLANKEAKIDLSSPKTLFVLSTTKGNVDLLERNNYQSSITNCQLFLWHSAKIISQFFGNKNTPIVVSNACISGACAQIAAMRELESGNYDYAVVVGADFLSKFIISGFQSFKALSPELCKPFDKDRCGLNLGEAAATIIFARHCGLDPQSPEKQGFPAFAGMTLQAGAIRNDANHISAPSRTGEGSFRALHSILNTDYSIPEKDIAFINAHGTATPYNDAMEAAAITRAGLQNVPVNSLKQFFGHTLGAAGVLESIISMRALENEIVIGMNDEQNFENQINISRENSFSDKKYFIKMLSGFGGCNAALLYKAPSNSPKGGEQDSSPLGRLGEASLFIKSQIHLSFKNSAEITDFYRSLEIDYPKFFKMDNISKLGFLASEKIFENSENRFEPREDIAVICFNRSSSLEIDTQYQKTIERNENYFPSPSLFVYTLPNIVAGEIAIRNKFLGETSFYISEKFDAAQICRTVSNSFSDKNTNFVLAAWTECFEGNFEVKMFLVTTEKTEKAFSAENL
jgi:3-oxoacyl-[acyl-carrier-protein] synthase-1